MTLTPLRSALALALLLPLAACADPGATGSPDGDANPAPASSGLVLRAEYTGGFMTPALIAGRLPIVSVYADGRVISEGPVPAIYPGPAWPNVQVTHLDEDALQVLFDDALGAGVRETTDLGNPPVADAPSTRFTAVTAEGTFVREVYALSEGGLDDGALTPEQQEARAELRDLLDALTAAAGSGSSSESYVPEVVAALAGPWVDPGDGLAPPATPWPGPDLVAQPVGALELTCVTAAGAQAPALQEAARAANAATPWTTPDGARWSVLFRPLLPDESDCADLTG